MIKLFKNLFIFEMANNHEGKVKHGVKIINAMAHIASKYNIKAGVKLQYRDLDTFIHPDFINRDDVKHIPRFLKNRLTSPEFLTLVNRVREQGMIPIATPFDEVSVEQCVDHGIQIIKVGSCSATDWPLLEAIAATKKPVIVSTGGLSIYDIDNVVSFFTHINVNFALMHCVAIYPAPNQKLQLSFIERMIKRYPNVPIGYSGHEAPDNLDAVKIAVSKGAVILERHVGIPTETIKLNKYSLTPEQTEVWVASAALAKEISGSSDVRQVNQEEIDSLLSLRRGVYAAKKIKQGEAIKREDVFFAMPCAEEQTTSSQFGKHRATFIASKDYTPNEAVCEYRQPDKISIIREVAHDAKGMLYEANITLGKDFKVELSHHRGMKHFRQTGAVMIHMINRDYCKKIIVILPGQHHPSHSHKIKEETFQLLWGDLEVGLSGKTVQMEPGDKLLVKQKTPHSFTTREGAIFEEISTTYMKDDSYYEDEKINALDPMERKTFLESW